MRKFIFLFMFLSAMAKGATLLTYTPSSATVFPDGISAKGITYASGALTFDGSGGLYVKHNPAWVFQSVTIEMVVSLAYLNNVGGGLCVKSPGMSFGITNQTFYTDWMNGSGDAYNFSSDKKNGVGVLTSGVKYTLKWSYDATTGMVATWVNNIQEQSFYRICEPSSISMLTSQSFQFMTRMPGAKLYKLTITNDRPAIRSMRTICTESKIWIDRIDPTFLNTATSIEIQNMYGKRFFKSDFTLSGNYEMPVTLGDKGIYTVIIRNAKGFYIKKQIVQGVPVVMPPAGFKGIYNVRISEMANWAPYVDFFMQGWMVINWDKNALATKDYLDEAQRLNKKLLFPANFQAARQTSILNSHPAIMAFYSEDEVEGELLRMQTNFIASRLVSSLPVFNDLNDFTDLEAVESCNAIMLNIYNLKPDQVQKITDLIRIFSKYRPVVVVLGCYEQLQLSPDLIRAQWNAASGAYGRVWFENDHRAKGTTGGWWLPEHPDQFEAIKQVLSTN